MASQWYYKRVGGKTSGPFSGIRLRQLASSGQLRPNDSLRMDGNKKTVRAGDIEGVFPHSSPDTVSPATA